MQKEPGELKATNVTPHVTNRLKRTLLLNTPEPKP